MSIAPISATPLDSVGATRGRHNHGGGHRVAMDAAAQALGMSAKDLRTALTGGQTIASVATSKGISTDTVKSAISDALATANPNMTADRVQQLAQGFLEGPKNAVGAPKPGDVDNDGDSR